MKQISSVEKPMPVTASTNWPLACARRHWFGVICLSSFELPVHIIMCRIRLLL